ncbi:MAG: nucleotide exchange factor GrpE [bacterium]|nr:nucleotide exchange factor GrpE [bacterium]
MTDQGDVVEISYVPDEEDVEHEVPDEPKSQKTTPAGKKKPTAGKKLQKKLKELEDTVEKVNEEKEEFKDKYLRSLAEVDNFRKRVKKEKEEYQKYVLGDFLLGLLEVLDNLERALKAKTTAEKTGNSTQMDEKSIISGVEMIHKQLLDLLKKNKVEEIDALGRTFDPNIHQALSKEEREGIPDPVILEVYQKGFIYNGKLLRPTLAKVAMPVEKEEEPAPGDENVEDETETTDNE